MQAMARARFVRTSPRKARLVIDEIRGKYVNEALAMLQFTPNTAARLIEKVVKSAAANAENNHHMDGDNLKIAVAMVDGGPNVMKRVRHAPMGRGYRIVKRMSHITIAVEEGEPRPEKKGKKIARTAKPAKRGGAPAAAAPAEKAEKPAKRGGRKPKEEPAAKAVEPEAKPVEPEVVAPVGAVEAEPVQVEETPVVQAETAEVEAEAPAVEQEAQAEPEAEKTVESTPSGEENK